MGSRRVVVEGPRVYGLADRSRFNVLMATANGTGGSFGPVAEHELTAAELCRPVLSPGPAPDQLPITEGSFELEVDDEPYDAVYKKSGLGSG